MRKICVLTGSRAEYGLLKPIMLAIKNHPKLELSTIVTGMHLSKEFGYSLNEIKKDGFEINEKVEMNQKEDTGFSVATSIGTGIKGIAKALNRVKPDIFMILGDRSEALAGAITAAYMNIPVAHIHGGDSARAGVDESARHAITKFAHIHFPATKKSAERILKMGECKDMIFVTGAPCLDTILHLKLLEKREIEKKFKLVLKKPFILLVQHSVSTEPEKAEEQITQTLEAIKKLKHQTVIIYPNSDAGGRNIIKKLKEYEKLPFIRTFKNLSQKEYLSLLKYASVMVGNSSSGIIESSSFNIPVVNIGRRQEGRERSGNVIDASHNKDNIIFAIKKALYDEDFNKIVKGCKNQYGNGHTSEKIIKILNEIDISQKLLRKKIIY